MSIKELNEILYCVGKVNMIEPNSPFKDVRDGVVNKITDKLNAYVMDEMRKQGLLPVSEECF